MIETLDGDGGLGFRLVLWQPVLGQHITGIVRDGGGIDWNLDRNDPLDCDCRICRRIQGEPPDVVPQRTAGWNRSAGGMNRSAWLWCRRSIAGIPVNINIRE